MNKLSPTYANKQAKPPKRKAEAATHSVRNGKAGGKGKAQEVRKAGVGTNGTKGRGSPMGKAKRTSKKVAK